jgi:hypothetical protein
LADPKDISIYTADQGTGTMDLCGGVDFRGWVTGEGGTGTYAPNASKWDEGAGAKYWQISTSTEGFSEIRLGSKQRSSNTGPRDFKVQYSTDGTTWADVPGAQITVANNFTTGVLAGIELPADCDNQPALHLRWIMAGNASVNDETVGSAGTSRIDGIELTGTSQDPFLTADPGAISGLSTIEGSGPSLSDGFVLEGSNLEPDNATISITAPFYFEVSLNNTDFHAWVDVDAVGGALSQEVFVRLASGFFEGEYTGDVTVSGGSASSIAVALSGQVREKVFLLYEFAGESAGPTQQPENATTSDFQISSGSISYGSSHASEWGGSGVPYAQGSGWTAETIDDAKHLGFNVSAHSGYFIGLSRISFFYRRTGAGPQHIAIEVNGTEIGRLEDVAPDEVLFFDQALSLVYQSDVDVQIKGWGGGSGDFRINDMRLDGEITAAAITTWSGAGNSDWHQPENWSDGIPDAHTDAVIPGAHTDAVIPGDAPHFPTIDPDGSDAAVNNLLLENGASLLDNGKLTIHGDFVMERAIDDGGFAWHFISAPVSGMPVVGSDFVPAPPWTTPRTFDFYAFNEAAQSTAKQSAQSASAEPARSACAESPQSACAESAQPDGEQSGPPAAEKSPQSVGKQLAQTAAEQSARSTGKQSVRRRSHPTAAESAKPWINVRVDGENASPAFVNFVPGQGYLVAYHEDYPVKTFAFSGQKNDDKIQMNTGNINIVLGYSSDADPCHQGWNLLGNPYPSGIDWAALASHALFENVYAYVYNPNKTGGAGYEIIGPVGPGVDGQVIAPNQGFFVKAAPIADGQTFTFTDNIRVHGGSFLKDNDQQDS